MSATSSDESGASDWGCCIYDEQTRVKSANTIRQWYETYVEGRSLCDVCRTFSMIGLFDESNARLMGYKKFSSEVKSLLFTGAASRFLIRLGYYTSAKRNQRAESMHVWVDVTEVLDSFLIAYFPCYMFKVRDSETSSQLRREAWGLVKSLQHILGEAERVDYIPADLTTHSIARLSEALTKYTAVYKSWRPEIDMEVLDVVKRKIALCFEGASKLPAATSELDVQIGKEIRTSVSLLVRHLLVRLRFDESAFRMLRDLYEEINTTDAQFTDVGELIYLSDMEPNSKEREEYMMHRLAVDPGYKLPLFGDETSMDEVESNGAILTILNGVVALAGTRLKQATPSSRLFIDQLHQLLERLQHHVTRRDVILVLENSVITRIPCVGVPLTEVKQSALDALNGLFNMEATTETLLSGDKFSISVFCLGFVSGLRAWMDANMRLDFSWKCTSWWTDLDNGEPMLYDDYVDHAVKAVQIALQCVIMADRTHDNENAAKVSAAMTEVGDYTTYFQKFHSAEPEFSLRKMRALISDAVERLDSVDSRVLSDVLDGRKHAFSLVYWEMVTRILLGDCLTLTTEHVPESLTYSLHRIRLVMCKMTHFANVSTVVSAIAMRFPEHRAQADAALREYRMFGGLLMSVKSNISLVKRCMMAANVGEDKTNQVLSLVAVVLRDEDPFHSLIKKGAVKVFVSALKDRMAPVRESVPEYVQMFFPEIIALSKKLRPTLRTDYEMFAPFYCEWVTQAVREIRGAGETDEGMDGDEEMEEEED
jgi:hypothetical protein